MDNKLNQNRYAWNKVAQHFYGDGVLPCWGVLGEGAKESELIGTIEGKTFLEIACGSGHSIKFLLEQGAKKVYGLDISDEQIKFAKETNKKAVEEGRAELFHTPMEQEITIPKESIDTVFSIYGLGWTQDHEETLSHIYSYLKPSGRLVFSFETQLFARTDFDETTGTFSFNGSGTEDYVKTLENWFGAKAYVIYRLPETWINSCIKLGFKLVKYLEPKTITSETKNPNLSSYYDLKKVEKIAPTFILVFEK
ncbi:MAG: class I SAM-dependent methyltransferase [Candidatus Paceibacterota bacterium]